MKGHLVEQNDSADFPQILLREASHGSSRSLFSGDQKARYEPLIKNQGLRACTGVVLVAGLSYIAAVYERASYQTILWPLLLGWAVSIWLTDKYRHKYAQRYYPYLLASHCKAGSVMAAALLPFALFFQLKSTTEGIFLAAVLVSVADFLVSVPRRRMKECVPAGELPGGEVPSPVAKSAPLIAVMTDELARSLGENAFVQSIEGLHAMVTCCMKGSDTGLAGMGVIEGDSAGPGKQAGQVAFLLQKKSLNTVKRLNLFLMGLPDNVLMGGYFAFRYRPMDEYLKELVSTKKGLGLWWSYGWHFLRHRALPKIPVLERTYFSKSFSGLDAWVYSHTKENRRVISRAEMWGRMYYWGFEVLDERRLGEDCWVVARRVREPETARKPSFFLVAKLTKVGLEGQPMQLHKLRTMYPFSEFIQEKIYKDHGLSNTGKFQNDFRLTDYGRLIRRFWLDEIPQIFDWLHGEIKLVGMRATSPQFLSLYPKELYDLYIQTKPGLVPPIFDATTTGFNDIVKIELAYLVAYQRRPVVTDVRYFFRTLNDIIIRGVRSK